MPTVASILRFIGAADKPEAEQRAAVLQAVAEKRLARLELGVMRDAAWIV